MINAQLAKQLRIANKKKNHSKQMMVIGTLIEDAVSKGKGDVIVDGYKLPNFDMILLPKLVEEIEGLGYRVNVPLSLINSGRCVFEIMWD